MSPPTVATKDSFHACTVRMYIHSCTLINLILMWEVAMHACVHM